MDLETLVAEVQTRTGRTDKDSVAETGIRFALTKISQLFPFDQLRRELTIAVASGDTQITIPGNVDEIIELRLIVPATVNMSYSMNLRRKTWFVQRFPNVPNTIVTGRPYFCYREDDVLHFDRVSNGSYNIVMTAFTTGSYVSGSDESALSGSDECLIAYGVKQVYESIQMYQDAQYWQSQFGQHLGALITQKSRENGVKYIAEEWHWQRGISPNQPWLDPFAGQNVFKEG